jgi:hypothetical protein
MHIYVYRCIYVCIFICINTHTGLIQELPKEEDTLNVALIFSLGKTANAESSDLSIEEGESANIPVNSLSKPMNEEQLVEGNNEGKTILVNEQQFLSISHSPQPPPLPRSNPNTRIAATTINPPMVVSNISSFPIFPMNFDKKIQLQKSSVQNVKKVMSSGVGHVIFGSSKDTYDLSSSSTSSQSTASSFSRREEVLRSSSTMVARRAHKEYFRMQKIEERKREDQKLAGLMGWANAIHVVCTDQQEQKQEQQRQEDEKAYNDRYNQPRVCSRSINQEPEIIELDINTTESYKSSDDNVSVPQGSTYAKGRGSVNNSSVGVGQLLGGSLADVDIDVGNAMYSDSLTVKKIEERARLKDEEINRAVILKSDVPSIRFGIKYGSILAASPSTPAPRRSSSAPRARSNRIALRHKNIRDITLETAVICSELV